jgi:hypothetical protein
MVEMREECFFFGQESELSGMDYLKYYKNDYNLNQKINKKISNFIRSKIRLIDPHINFVRFFGTLIMKKKVREQRYLDITEMREQFLDFNKVDLLTFKKTGKDYIQDSLRIAKYSFKNNDSLSKNIAMLKNSIGRIRQRGGEVLFTRFPVSPNSLAESNHYFPRKKYWDEILATLNVTGIHFNDFEELKSFECPDDSHIDMREKLRFSDGFIRVVKKILNATKDQS